MQLGDADWLRGRYEHVTGSEIAVELGVTPRTVYLALERHDIDVTRSPWVNHGYVPLTPSAEAVLLRLWEAEATIRRSPGSEHAVGSGCHVTGRGGPLMARRSRRRGGLVALPTSNSLTTVQMWTQRVGSVGGDLWPLPGPRIERRLRAWATTKWG
jgi:hypothetical protein